MRQSFSCLCAAFCAFGWALPAAQAQEPRPGLGETASDYRARIGETQRRPVAGKALAPKLGETKAEYEARVQGRPVRETGVAQVQADRQGQFRTVAIVKDQKFDVLVDTGASAVSLPYEVAQRLGFKVSDADFRDTARTANGSTKVAPITLDEVQVGDIVVRNVAAVVGKPGALGGTALLGMSFLSKLQKYEMANGVLKLVR